VYLDRASDDMPGDRILVFALHFSVALCAYSVFSGAPVKTGGMLRMKESYAEGLANHGGPESCVHARKGVGEALTGVRAGRVLSREIRACSKSCGGYRGVEAVRVSRRPHWRCRIGEAVPDPARSETPCTRGNISHGNREIPRPSAARWEALAAERIVKPSGARR